MGIFFGTDGIRGEVNNDLTEGLAIMIGNALARKKEKATIIVGRDTRVSGSYLTCAFSSGALKGGADVVDVGIMPTASISYLVKEEKADYGVVISASHNPKEYNGIKIFDANGRKISEKEECALEREFVCPLVKSATQVGRYIQEDLSKKYINFLLSSCCKSLKELKIVLDCANGAAYKIAPHVFKKLGAEVIAVNAENDGEKINERCGATNVEMLAKTVVKEGADVGFAYDGDADRLISVDENGKVLNGDEILYILAKHFSLKGELNSNTVVGTSHTNSGVLFGLNRNKINLIRTDIGDKYVIEAMEKMNLSLGGEQSGHIIIRKHLPTGDGILASLQLASIMVERGEPLSKICDVKLLSQLNKNIVVADKIKVINNESLTRRVSQILTEIAPEGRILVRASGTEPKIRIMVEHKNVLTAEKIMNEIENIVKNV